MAYSHDGEPVLNFQNKAEWRRFTKDLHELLTLGSEFAAAVKAGRPAHAKISFPPEELNARLKLMADFLGGMSSCLFMIADIETECLVVAND